MGAGISYPSYETLDENCLQTPFNKNSLNSQKQSKVLMSLAKGICVYCMVVPKLLVAKVLVFCGTMFFQVLKIIS